ncbi:MAG TPA: hypothetical protein VGB57_01755 [Allosphingosinicella sp.]|jgi:hypothetical protein
MSDPAPSFANDIAPMFSDYQAQMAWRFDLTSYDDVKANARIIYNVIYWDKNGGPQMPPGPFPPFPSDFVQLFANWIDTGYGA